MQADNKPQPSKPVGVESPEAPPAKPDPVALKKSVEQEMAAMQTMFMALSSIPVNTQKRVLKWLEAKVKELE